MSASGMKNRSAILLFVTGIFLLSTNSAMEMSKRLPSSVSLIENTIAVNVSSSSGLYKPWTRPDVVFAHIHMAKTAGTTLNGRFAALFERVCGHKGYSYDYYQYNERGIKRMNVTGRNSIHVGAYKHNRGRVDPKVMDEIGYEDCDYISHETEVAWWGKLQHLPLEFHVPCREHVQHLMSMCNERRHLFDCEAKDIKVEIERCKMFTDTRFSDKLQEYSKLPLKCFNPIPMEPYEEYMGNILQPKRMPVTNIVHRTTNQARPKTKECIFEPENKDLKNRVEKLLLEMYDYHRFCDTCAGSENDLLKQKSS
ncbi:unnamed protein product [Cylindrotheca closterium]|uniref:Uncharacterized protein n=1 Tax=Cylindrotheca closterium TaxID=2856 RepID=A0AAD2CL24_9STRA|nr:unnamed protein product [Cylindrotheca closterium]